MSVKAWLKGTIWKRNESNATSRAVSTASLNLSTALGRAEDHVNVAAASITPLTPAQVRKNVIAPGTTTPDPTLAPTYVEDNRNTPGQVTTELPPAVTESYADEQERLRAQRYERARRFARKIGRREEDLDSVRGKPASLAGVESDSTPAAAAAMQTTQEVDLYALERERRRAERVARELQRRHVSSKRGREDDDFDTQNHYSAPAPEEDQINIDATAATITTPTSPEPVLENFAYVDTNSLLPEAEIHTQGPGTPSDPSDSALVAQMDVATKTTPERPAKTELSIQPWNRYAVQSIRDTAIATLWKRIRQFGERENAALNQQEELYCQRSIAICVAGIECLERIERRSRFNRVESIQTQCDAEVSEACDILGVEVESWK